GLLSAIHWNAVAAGAGLLATNFFLEDPARKFRRTLWMVFGMGAGALAAFRAVDPEKFLLSLRTVNYLVSTPPPLLADPAHPWRWVGHTLHTFLLGQTSFFDVDLVSGWRFVILCSWVGLILSLAGAVLTEN